jgi:hypothetical protein
MLEQFPNLPSIWSIWDSSIVFILDLPLFSSFFLLDYIGLMLTGILTDI